MTKPLRAAVIGVGYLGRFHAQKYGQLVGLNLVAVVDADIDRAQAVASEFQGCRPLTEVDDLFDEVDLVSVVVPTQLHFETTKPFLERGIHVLLEKPMTVTVEEAKELNAIAQRTGALLQIGHLERFNPALMAVTGQSVAPLFIESHRLAPYKPRGADVNVVLDLMIHDVDIILNMVGADIARISASGAKILSETIDIANARLEFSNGCVANVTSSRVSHKTERKMRIFAHQSYLTIDFQERRFGLHRRGERELYPGIPEIVSEETSFESADALLTEIQAFVAAVLGEGPVIVSGLDGQRALETAIRITELVHEGPTSLDQPFGRSL
jgi:predicted dehydrogenase